VAGDLPLYDFLHAVSEVALNFATVWTVNLERMEADNESLPDLFRAHNCQHLRSRQRRRFFFFFFSGKRVN
jgi:hypothetical protein